MSDNLQGPMQSAFSRVLPKVTPPAQTAPAPGHAPVVPPKAVAPTTKARQIYNAMVATPGQTVRFYAAAAESSYNGTYIYLMRMQEAGFARQASLPNAANNTKYWRATGQWNDEAWEDANPNAKAAAKSAVKRVPKPPRAGSIPAPVPAVEPPPLEVYGGRPETPTQGCRLVQAKPEEFNLENMTIGDARRLYDALKKLFG